MAIEARPFDTVEILTSDDRIETYLQEAFETGETGVIANAIGNVLRARNITAISRETGITRETIYRAFSKEGNPTLATLTAIVTSLGFKLSIQPASAAE
jgi:probable addiction module antidote protein